MKKIYFSSLRVWFIFIILLSILPALGLSFYLGIKTRRHYLDMSKNHVLNQSKEISDQQKELVNNGRQILFTLSQLPQIRERNPIECQKIFDKLLKNSITFTGFAAFAPNGDVFASAPLLDISILDKPTNFADRDWFKRVVQTQEFVTGEYLIGRISGKPTVVLAYPVLGSKAELKAVVTVGLDLDWINEFFKKPDLPKGSTLKVIDRNGTVLVRYPDFEEFMGKSWGKKPFIKTILSQKNGVVEEIGLDGVQRIFGFTSIGEDHKSFFVLVGIPKKIALAEAHRQLILNLSLLGVVLILAISATWLFSNVFIMRRVDQLVGLTNRLSEGDLSTRASFPGSDEISQIALAFNHMADSIQHRESERRRAEVELSESEKKYREIFNSVNDAIYMYEVTKDGRPGRFIEVNDIACKRLGYSREEYMSMSTIDINDKKAAIKIPKIMDQLLRKGHVVFEMIHVAKDGTKIPVEINAHSVTFGDQIKILSVIRDISERKKAEESLRFEKEKFRILVEDSPLGISIIGKDGDYQYVNPKFIEMFGYTLEDIPTGREWFNKAFPDPEYRDQVISTWTSDIMESKVGSSKHREFSVTCKDGSKKTIQFIPVTLKTGDQIVVYEDITEQEKIEAQVRQAQKMEAIGSLAGGVAHDFNNLLTSIIGNAELAFDDINRDNPLYESLEDILDSAQRAASLTRQLLAFSRKQIFQLVVLNFNTVITDMMKMLGRMIGEDVVLVTDLEPELMTVEIDPAQLDQVIMNLVINARDAMPKGGKITIETSNVWLDEDYARDHGVDLLPGPYVMLAISDTGIGMGKETQSHIFDPFFTTKEKGKGTGLGLSTVYGIIKQTGGYIWVYSELGQGTTFKIYLPGVEKKAEPVKREQIPFDDLRGAKTILIVEDDESLRKLTGKILKRYGYDVIEAKNGEDALNICDDYKTPIHLMITDVVMPGMNGRELAERLKLSQPELKVIYMSGYTDNIIAERGFLAEGVNFIEKPFAPESLAAKVRKVLYGSNTKI